MPRHLRALGSQQPPYCRTNEFSELTHEILSGLRYVFQTSGQVMILTGSGTAAMETVPLNFALEGDQALVINGGTFGQRWCDLCEVHGVSHETLQLGAGESLDMQVLTEALGKGVTVLFATAHETSTGALFDIEAIGRITHRMGILLVVDAISTICADRFLMDEWHVDIAILSSQKGLALPPGLAFLAMSDLALRRLENTKPRSLYFDVRDYLANQERGQMPFTPATGLFLQLHQRLIDIKQLTLEHLIDQHSSKANIFRDALTALPLGVLPTRSSNAITAVTCDKLNAPEVVNALRVDHGIEVAPNGGDLRQRIFRVSHMGEHHAQDLEALIEALEHITGCDITSRNITGRNQAMPDPVLKGQQ